MFKKLGLRAKLVVILSIPVVCLLLFALNSLWTKADVLRSTTEIQQLANMSKQASALVHELQAERGMTAGYIASKGSLYRAQLGPKREQTDAKLDAYLTFERSFNVNRFGEDFARGAQNIQTQLAGLKDMRARIDGLEVTGNAAVGFYTKVIGGLLDSVRYASLLSTDRNMTRMISAYDALLQGKEYAGQERAVLNSIFAAKRFDGDAYRHLAATVALENLGLGNFDELASSELKQQFSDNEKSHSFQEVQRMREAALQTNAGADALAVQPSYWFNMATQRIDALKKVEDSAASSIVDYAQRLYSTTMLSFIVLMVVAVLAIAFTLLVGWAMTRNILRSINALIEELFGGASQTLNASKQVASASQSLAEGASEQAASLEEISSTLEELSSMTRQNADSSTQVESLSDGVNDSAKQGVSAMGRMESAIKEIKDSSDQTAKIIKTIDEIAFQTNLLALNAAVEAARAGDAGKGFAVVAEEVRNLAQRSAQAARSTSELIETSQQRADAGVAVSKEVQTALEQVNAAINQVLPLIKDVSTASGEQSRGLEQVNEALAQMDTVTQSNASNAEENSASSEELSAQAESLNTIVDALLQLIYGHGQGGDRLRIEEGAGHTRSASHGHTNGHALPGPGHTNGAEGAPKATGGKPTRLGLKEKIEQDQHHLPLKEMPNLHGLGDADFRDMN
ncbi:MAG TPA: methyl-accepting chemotaxis protein [bacterium]|nr:methyl-accepting chemotaxis protein [bacterium]